MWRCRLRQAQPRGLDNQLCIEAHALVSEHFLVDHARHAFDPANLQTAQLDGRADGEAGDVFVKDNPHCERISFIRGKQAVPGRGFVLENLEHRAVRDTAGTGHKSIKCQAPAHEGREGGKIDLRAAWPHGKRKTRCVPEPCRRRDQAIVRCVDDRFGNDKAAAGCNLRLADPTHFNAPERDRAVFRQAATCSGAQGNLHAFLAKAEQGRFGQSCKAAGFRADVAIPGPFDVDTCQNGIEAGDPARTQFRAHNPETCAYVDIGRYVLVQPHLSHHTGQAG